VSATPRTDRQETLRRLVPSTGDVGFDPAPLTVDAVEERVCPGDRVHSGDPACDGLVVVRHGDVRQFLERSDGSRILLGVVGPGAVVGDAPTVASLPEPLVSVAHAETVLGREPAEVFHERVMRDAGRWERWIAATTGRLLRVQRRLTDILALDLHSRIASLLLEADPDGPRSVSVSHADLALLLGARRASVSRALRGLRRDGLVDTGYEHIELLDPEGLRRVLRRARRRGRPGAGRRTVR
jgi:CRP-like cAMP-binding protein